MEEDMCIDCGQRPIKEGSQAFCEECSSELLPEEEDMDALIIAMRNLARELAEMPDN